MTEYPYRVDYHVLGVVYLEQGRELSGPDFARLWSGARIFGKHKVTGDFWHAGMVPSGTHRIELGDLSMVQPLLDLGNMPIFGGGVLAKQNVARNAIVDRDFYYAHSSGSRSSGYETRPQLLYAVSGQWFEQTGSEAVIEHLREHFDIADHYCPPYGLIDLSSSEDCFGGSVYDPSFCVNSHLHRWAEDFRWLYACSKRRDQARGIYWGNYFGAAILDRLGGRAQFLTRFRRQAQYPDGRPSAQVWEFNNGVFVSLCMDPLGCKPGQPLDGWAGQNMHWLVLELGSHGVLNPWAGERPVQSWEEKVAGPY
jgi:hypothetical protein